VRQYLIQLIWDRKIDPGKLFDLLPSSRAGVQWLQALNERRATGVLLAL
jgi:hypothetical protein